jgi:glycosyltransferase involved in cell wall biosynthesis
VVTESRALGRPLVAPAHGGALEMIDHDRTGLLFAPGDAAALAAAILRLHAEPGLGARLGRAARERALQTFSVEAHVARVQAVYERLLEGPAQRAVGARRQGDASHG